jgi:hypothetical protein
MKIWLGIRQGVGFAVLVALCGVVSIAVAQETSQTPKVWASDELKWEHDKTLASVQSVLLWGTLRRESMRCYASSPLGMHRHHTSIRRQSG